MKPVLSTEEVVRLEDIIEREGTSKAELMELAGEFAANEILKLPIAFLYWSVLATMGEMAGLPLTF